MEFIQETGRIYGQNSAGETVAQITFPLVDPATADIDHTFVDPSLRGQGVAAQLMEAAIGQIRSRGLQTRASCPYAAKWFAAHPDQADLLAQDARG